MQPLELNLASRPFKNNTLLWIGYGLAVIVLVLFTVWNVRSFSRHRTLVVDLDREVSTIERQFQDLERRRIQAQQAIRGYDLEALALQADKADDVIRWKAFSWTRLFNRLERIQPYDVRMTSIHPIFRSRRERRFQKEGEEEDHGLPVSVEGVAKDHAAFLDLERALLSDLHFDRVEPSRTAREKVTDHTIFDLRFVYDPDAIVTDEVVEVADAAADAPDTTDAPAASEAATPEPGPVVAEQAAAAAEPPKIERPQAEPAQPAEVTDAGFGDRGVGPEADAVEAAGPADATGAAEAVLNAPNRAGSEEVFPDNPPPQTQTPRARRPTSRQPPAPKRRAKPRSTRRGEMGGR